MAASATAIGATPRLSFHKVNGSHSAEMSEITKIFQRVLEPLYGSQTKALQQIEESRDRSAFLLYEESKPVGVLVFKNVPSNEYQALGVSNSIEIKSLFVDHAAQNSGKGFGSRLVDKLYEELKKMELSEDGVHVTVSETRSESLLFFQKKHFQIMHAWDGRYQPGTREFLLSCPHRIRQQAAIQIRSHVLPQGVIFEISRAHIDSIHGFVKGIRDTFISASKDSSVFLWDLTGQKIRTVDEGEPLHTSDERWVTALLNQQDRYLCTGHRDGKLEQWTIEGDHIKNIPTIMPTFAHVSNRFNTNRITCLASGYSPSTIFIGFPTKFDEYHLEENQYKSKGELYSNDWVYAIHPFSEDCVFTVEGASAHLRKKEGSMWKEEGSVIPEESRYFDGSSQKMQRPFISSIAPINSSTSHIAATLFSGAVKIMDIEKKVEVARWQEHVGRVWQVISLSDGRIATCGDDQTVKLFDIKEKASTKNLAGFPAPVQALLNPKDHMVITGCGKNQSSGEAAIRAYDLRA